VEARTQEPAEEGWTVLATTVGRVVCPDAELLQAYHDQHSTVEPGVRWIKNPAAIAPVWLEKPERIAALAMLTVVGLLVYTLVQRRVRLYLQRQQQLPGNKGMTTRPTAAVTLALHARDDGAVGGGHEDSAPCLRRPRPSPDGLGRPGA
jgi:hypothetical protein